MWSVQLFSQNRVMGGITLLESLSDSNHGVMPPKEASPRSWYPETLLGLYHLGMVACPHGSSLSLAPLKVRLKL